VNLREALIIQSPSLELQRAAADEIARLDGVIKHLATIHYETQAQLGNVMLALNNAVAYYAQVAGLGFAAPDDGDTCERLLGFIESAINCTKKETA
jgi:hypothetical protein